MAFTAVLFLAYPLPCWTQAQKCRLLAVGRRTSGGKLLESIGAWADTLEATEGTKTRPRKARGGRWWYQDFFAVSQMIIKGRIKINRIINRGPPPPR